MSKDAAFLNVDFLAEPPPLAGAARCGGGGAGASIAQTTGRGELIARILAGRGIELEAVERHLEPTLRDLMPDPHSSSTWRLRPCDSARAVEGQERVAIFGDYDVDGACAAALISEYLTASVVRRLIGISRPR